MKHGKGSIGTSLSGGIFCSARAMKRQRNKNKQLDKRAKEQSGPCHSRKVSPQEMEALRNVEIYQAVKMDPGMGFFSKD